MFYGYWYVFKECLECEFVNIIMNLFNIIYDIYSVYDIVVNRFFYILGIWNICIENIYWYCYLCMEVFYFISIC